MKKLSLQAKIGALMFVAVILVVATGFLSYKSLSSVITLIYNDAKPDYRLLTVKSISTDLEKAENSVRIYTITRKESALAPYYHGISTLDDRIYQLKKESKNDDELLAQIDTISNLIEDKFVVWGEMLDIYNDGNIVISLRKLSDEISKKPDEENNLLKRFFKQQQTENLTTQKIAQKIIDIEEYHQQKELKIKEKELQLAQTNDKITGQFYSILEQIEKTERDKIKKGAQVANYMANRTYLLLTLFSVAVTILALLVLFIVVRYTRKAYAYQKALEKSKTEAENLASAKELFMANVSHEIRTPLNALAGFLEQILSEPLNYDVRKKLNIVKSSSDHLIRIIADILDFSMLQSGKMKLENTHFRIETVLQEIFILFESRAKNNNNELIYEPPEIPVPVLLGDPHRLQQIMYNLLSNAIKFTQHGKVRFSAEVLQASEKITMAIKVEDTGIGIPVEKIDRIFDDFSQAGPEINRKYGGTGLGLSIVKKLVELHNGTIHVKTNPNKGSSFTCYLEYEPGDAMKIEQPVQAQIIVPNGIQNLNVLLVDDEEYNRLLVQSIFKKWNVSYAEAVNGIDAIELVKSENFDLILMDSRMPVLDGVKATTFIRTQLDSIKSKVPIITITAAVYRTDQERYIRSGTDAILEKPFSEEKLFETIRSVLDKKGISTIDRKVNKPDMPETEPNLSELYRLAGDNINFIREMLLKFMETTEKGLQLMTDFLASGDFVRMKEEAHKLSSPCRHLGANRLLQILKQIENDVSPFNSTLDLQALIVQARIEYDFISIRITDHLNILG